MVNVKMEDFMDAMTQQYLVPKAELKSDSDDLASTDEDISYASDNRDALSQLRHDLETVKEFVGSRKDKDDWEEELQTLLQRVDGSPTTRTVVVVGHAGHGKTTLLNSLLNCPVLTTGSSGRACTSAVVEVHYEDTPSYRAEIEFLSSDAWNAFLELLVADVLEGCTKLPSINDNQASSGADDSASTLVQLFPHLSGKKVTADISVDSLASHPSVVDLVGTISNFTADSPEELEQKLRTYLSTRQGPDQPRLWYIIDVARVFGCFDMLSTGTVLVDLPGYGDSNTFRAKKAEEFLKRADTIILVSDIRRVADDANTHRYLKKSIERFVGFDGRTVREDALIMAVTGSDNQISEAQFDFQSDKQKAFVRSINEQIEPIAKKLEQTKVMLKKIAPDSAPKPTRKGSKSTKKLPKPVHEPPKLDDSQVQHLMQVKAYIDELNEGLNTLRREKYSYLALRRNDQVVEHVQNLYKSTYREIDKERATTVVPISVHVVGSVDYRRLQKNKPLEEPPLVFDNEDDTGIPTLQHCIFNVALRERSLKLISVIKSFEALASEINQYYNTQLFSDLKYAAKAKQALEELQQRNQITQSERVNMIGELIDTVLTSIQKAAESSASKSHQIVYDLGTAIRHNTYKALMRRHGAWKDTDLNDDLAEDMRNEDVLRAWHGMLNVELLAQLETMNKDLIAHVGGALNEIADEAESSSSSARQNSDGSPAAKRFKQDLGHAGSLASCIQQARASVKYKDALDNAHKSAVASVKGVQRSFGGTFNELVQRELSQQYDLVASEAGPGMFIRMKARLEGYFQKNNETFFNGVVERIREPLSSIQELVDSTYRDELEKIYRTIRNTMVVEQRPLKEAERAGIQQHLAFITRARKTASDFANALRSDADKADREITEAAPTNHDD